ncbi:MAG: hypothetical protein EP298_06220 [Gammaproteobacteria bacterium]|nr:MAG: hypothetical protein EP298_06220 [Gammaproteobacteria bacterium]UTW41556.1 hypothetical protein KFE69_08545 [bacterium SCSIO 12844]
MKYFFIIIITILSYQAGYSAQDYNLEVVNNSNNYLYFYSYDKHCIHGGFSGTVNPHSSDNVDFTDDDGLGSCHGNRKHVNIKFLSFRANSKWFQESTNYPRIDGYPPNQACALGLALPYYLNKDCSSINELQTDVEWNHKTVGAHIKSNWGTMFETSENDGYLIISKATCDGTDCLNTYGEGGSDLKLILGYNPIKGSPVLPGYYKIVTVGLGKVYVTSNYNRKVKENDSGKVYLDPEKNIYTFHFTTSARGCTLANQQFQCPNTISATIPYYTGENTMLFVCQQSKSSQSKCPWVLSDENKNNYVFNYT